MTVALLLLSRKLCLSCRIFSVAEVVLSAWVPPKWRLEVRSTLFFPKLQVTQMVFTTKV